MSWQGDGEVGSRKDLKFSPRLTTLNINIVVVAGIGLIRNRVKTRMG